MNSISRKLLFIICLAGLLLGCALNVSAAVSVDFESVLREGLQNNYGIRLKQYAFEKSSHIVSQAQGYVTPYFKFDLTTGTGIDPTISNDGTNIFELNFIVPTRLGIDFYSGGHAECSKFLNPDMHNNNYGVWAGLRLPLLRGLGENSPANAAIRSAEKSYQASEQKLSNEIMIFFRDVLSAYFALSHDIDQYFIEKQALNQARKHQSEINELIAGGELPKIERNRSIAFVTTYEQLLNQAKLKSLNSYYDIRNLVGVDEKRVFFEIPELVDPVPDPDLQKVVELIDRNSVVDDAKIMATPVYKNISLLTDVEKIELDKAENQKFNQLDLDLKVSWFEMTTNSHYGDVFGTSYPGESALLQLNYTLPVRNIQQEGAYMAQRAKYESSRLSLRQILFESKLQVKHIVISLHQLVELYERDVELVDIRECSWRDEIRKFKLGSATQIDVLLSFDSYIESTRTLNDLKLQIHNLVIKLKYLLGDIPGSEDQLSQFSLANYFSTY